MKYSQKQVKEAIQVLDAEACTDMCSPYIYVRGKLANVTRNTVRMHTNVSMVTNYWRYLYAEAAQLLREGWRPGDELINLKTGEVLT